MGSIQDRAREVVDVCLNTSVLSTEPPPPIVFELQGLGDAGYQEVWVRLKSGKLPPEQMIRALQALAHFTRFGDFNRDIEILRNAMTFVGDNDVGVRTKAVHSVVWSARNLRAIAEQSARAKEAGLASLMPSDEELRSTVESGLERGVLPGYDEAARLFVRELTK
jgi:hypothetical protein